MKDQAAIVIKDLWGKVLSALVITGILSGIGFAFAQNAVNAKTETLVDSLKEDRAQQDTRLDTLDAKIDGVQDDLSLVREQSIRVETKLDLLLRNEGIPVR